MVRLTCLTSACSYLLLLRSWRRDVKHFFGSTTRFPVVAATKIRVIFDETRFRMELWILRVLWVNFTSRDDRLVAYGALETNGTYKARLASGGDTKRFPVSAASIAKGKSVPNRYFST